MYTDMLKVIGKYTQCLNIDIAFLLIIHFLAYRVHISIVSSSLSCLSCFWCSSDDSYQLIAQGYKLNHIRYNSSFTVTVCV